MLTAHPTAPLRRPMWASCPRPPQSSLTPPPPAARLPARARSRTPHVGEQAPPSPGALPAPSPGHLSRRPRAFCDSDSVRLLVRSSRASHVTSGPLHVRRGNKEGYFRSGQPISGRLKGAAPPKALKNVAGVCFFRKWTYIALNLCTPVLFRSDHLATDSLF